jgi:F-type H+-transporting ATPase subunit beta
MAWGLLIRLSICTIHRPAPSFTEQDTSVNVLETGVKVIDLLVPFPRWWRQDGDVRRRLVSV